MSSASRRWVVVDTGVLVSAAIRPGSVPALALHKVLLHFDLCASDATWAELETVLSRPKFDGYLGHAEREAFRLGLREHLTFFAPAEAVSDCSDPKDNPFLELALAAGAELVVSSDPHLTVLHPWRGIPILTPAGFLVAVV